MPITAPRLGIRNLMQGMMGGSPNDVPNDSASSIGHLVENTRSAVDASGMGVKAPIQEAPAVPDLGIQQQSRSNLGLAKMMQGITGTIPVTSYNSKQGVHAGMAMNSPSDQAAQMAATQGWADEQARVKNANTMHAFNNQYAKMKTDADNQTTQRSLDLAQMQMVSAGAKGYYGKMFAGADADRDLKAQHEQNWAGSIKTKNDLIRASLNYKDQANTRANEKHAKDMANVPAGDIAVTGHGDAAVESIRRFKELIHNEPEAMDLVNKSLHWQDVRASSSPLAGRVDNLRNEIMENLVQFQRRRPTKDATELIGRVLPMFQPNGNTVSLEGLDLLEGRLKNIIAMEEAAHPPLKNRPGMPKDTTGLPGGTPDIDSLMQKSGIK